MKTIIKVLLKFNQNKLARTVVLEVLDARHCIKSPLTRVWTNLCTDKNLHGSTLRFHGTGGTGRIFERLSVQVWDLKKAGQLFGRHGSIFVRTRVNTQTVPLFAQITRLWPGIKYCDWSKLCTDPCKQAIQGQNSSVQKSLSEPV